MAIKPEDLRRWLMKAPRGKRLEMLCGETTTSILLPEGGSSKRWAEIERTVVTSGASTVTLFDEKSGGNLLRRDVLGDEDGDGPGENNFDAQEKLFRQRDAAMAAMFDSYGRRLNEAHAMGAAAAGISQENLVGIVETLSAHLSLAITNIHTLSSAYANAVAQSGQNEEGGNAAIMGLLGALTGKLPLATTPPTPNGSKK